MSGSDGGCGLLLSLAPPLGPKSPLDPGVRRGLGSVLLHPAVEYNGLPVRLLLVLEENAADVLLLPQATDDGDDEAIVQ